MEGNIQWDAIPRKKRSTVPRKERVYGQGNVAEEETEVNGQGDVAEEETTETTKPKWVLEQMEKYEGYDANEIMEVKELKASDLDTNQGRLLLPKHVDRCFLNMGELGTLASGPKKGVNCLFIDTKGKHHDLELKDWANGLVLTKGWGNVIKKESFEVGEKYPLWSFRSRYNDDKLCFTLVKPDKVDDPIEALPNVDNEEDAKLSDTELEEVAKSDTEVLPNVDNKDAKKLSETEVEEVANKNDPESSFSFYAQEMVNHVSGTAAFKLAEVEKKLELVKEAAALRDRMIELAEQAELNLLLAEELHEACSQGKIVELN